MGVFVRVIFTVFLLCLGITSSKHGEAADDKSVYINDAMLILTAVYRRRRAHNCTATIKASPAYLDVNRWSAASL